MGITNDFRKYYRSIHPYQTTVLDDFLTKKGYQNPYILEEREMHVTQLDVFSRLMTERIIFFTDEVNETTCSIITAQLMYLNSVNNQDIVININSPGGGVDAGMGLIDTIGFIDSPVRTVNIAMAASMGLVLLSAGFKGKRVGLPHARYLLHQPLGGGTGSLPDVEIYTKELQAARETVYDFMATRTKLGRDKLLELSPRDHWFGSEKALEYGFIDEIQTIDWSTK